MGLCIRGGVVRSSCLNNFSWLKRDSVGVINKSAVRLYRCMTVLAVERGYEIVVVPNHTNRGLQLKDATVIFELAMPLSRKLSGGSEFQVMFQGRTLLLTRR